MKNKINFFILAFDFLLILLIGFSLEGKKNPGQIQVKSALVYSTENANRFSITDSEGDIDLYLKNNIWFYECEAAGIKDSIANQEKVKSFLNKLQLNLNMYKLSYNTDIKNFGFSSFSQKSLRVYMNDGTFQDIYFGNTDFSRKNIYVMGSKNRTIYTVETEAAGFLTSDTSFWGDPFIISPYPLGKIRSSDIQTIQTVIFQPGRLISSNILPNDDIFKACTSYILELRKGGAASDNYTYDDKEVEIKLELGNTNEILLTFYKINDSTSYIVKTTYRDTRNHYEITDTAIISSWTYRQIKNSCRML